MNFIYRLLYKKFDFSQFYKVVKMKLLYKKYQSLYNVPIYKTSDYIPVEIANIIKSFLESIDKINSSLVSKSFSIFETDFGNIYNYTY